MFYLLFKISQKLYMFLKIVGAVFKVRPGN